MKIEYMDILKRKEEDETCPHCGQIFKEIINNEGEFFECNCEES